MVHQCSWICISEAGRKARSVYDASAWMFRAAVIIQGDNFWQVREDLSILPNDRTITMGDYNNFEVKTLVGKLQYV